MYKFEKAVWLPHARESVFSFFSNARNLGKLTPATLNFEVLNPDPIEMKVGLLIDYRLKLRGIPMNWQSEITSWEPNTQFVDEQRRGPYRTWAHEHCFEDLRGGTLVTDRVSYSVWGGGLINRLIVAPELKRIFDYREQAMDRIFKVKSE